MDEDTLDALRERLLAMREAIRGLADTRREGGAVVELDQTRTGRLSRMDALQVQAMAQAGDVRARQELQQIEVALRRIEDGEYGDCLGCGEAIADARLQARPTATLCVACAEARES